MLRREFLAGLAALAPERKPNIVFVLLDDLGYGDFGCYGQQLIQTPAVDKLAREGTRFTDCYAGGAVCAPSRASLMTGLHGGHAPVRANAGTIPIEPRDVTMAEVLKQAGYATGGFGKWGLGDAGTDGRPTRQGFDEWFGYLHQVHAHSYYTDYLWDGENKFVIEANRDGKRGAYTADLIKDRTLAFIRKNKSRPFFCYAAWTLPHAKFEVPSLGDYASRDWHDNEKAYAAMVSRADSNIGELVATIRSEGLERDTLLVVASDNGAHDGMNKGFERFRSNGALRGTKGTLYEGGIRVPMIARWPGRVPAARVTAAPCAFWDLLPTFADLAGVQPPKAIDGVSLMPEILAKGPLPKREALYWEFHNFNLKTMQMQSGWQQAARMGKWKAVRLKPTAPVELYDLSADVSESHDVAAGNPKVVRELERVLRTYHTPPRPHDKGRAQPVTDL